MDRTKVVTRRLVRRAAGVGSGLLLAAGVATAFAGAVEATLALLAAGLLAQLVWTRLTSRAATEKLNLVSRELATSTEQQRAAAELVREQRGALGEAIVLARDAEREASAGRQALDRQVKQLDHQARLLDRTHELLRRHDTLLQKSAERDTMLRDELRSISVDVHRVPGQTVELSDVYDRLVGHHHPMPELGGWAISPATLLWLVDHVGTTSPRVVLECGSGSSTVWIATALDTIGGDGHVTALESDGHYAGVTRDALARLDLGHRATVLHAPLVDTALPGRSEQPWFDLSGLRLPDAIDLLLVDGPVGATTLEARYPAFPLLADRLSPEATVVLDDTKRPSEERIVGAWSTEVHAGRRLEQVRTVDRSTVFVTRPA